jgi:hypothetical protein
MPDLGERRTFDGQLAEWDGKGWLAVNADASLPRPAARTWTDTAVDAMPMAGGALGGIVGGIGGTVAGMGVGGLPGAVGGAALGGGAGEAAKQLVNRVRGQSAPTTMTEAATDIGTEGAIQGALEAGGGLAVKGLGAGAKAVYRGYLKPSLAKNAVGKAGEIVNTAIDEALPVTAGGIQKAQNVIGDLRRQVDGILATSPGTVDLHTVAEKVRAFAKAKYFRPGTPSADYEAALAVADSIDKHAALTLPAGAAPTRVTVPLTQANQAKRGIDRAIGEASFGTERGATKTTQKFARRELRQGIEAQAPEVGPLNAREGRLLDAAKALARAVGREENKSPLIGVNTLVSGVAGGESYRRTGDPFAAAGTALATRLALTPQVMTQVAIVASRLGKMPGAVPASVARVAVQAVLATQDEPEQQGAQP